MSQFEYLIVLVSILVGLGLADLTESLRDLVLPEMYVRWHALPVTWAVIVLGYVLTTWWMFYELLQWDVWYHPLNFLPVLLTTLMLYLLCAFALPDVEREEVSYITVGADGTKTIDMESFYLSAGHRRWFFGTAALFSLFLFTTLNIALAHRGERSLTSAMINILLTFPIFLIPHVILINTERKWIHWGLTLYSFGWITYLLSDVAVALSGTG